MKLKFIALALLPLTLAACQSTNMQKNHSSSTYISTPKHTTNALQAYQWNTVTDKALKPIMINFNNQNHVSISTSCNTLGSSWKVINNQLEFGQSMGTLMACDVPAMQQEKFASDLFSNQKLPFSLDMTNIEKPTLTISTSKGENIIFTGEMTPESRYQTEAETIFLEISPEVKPCTGVAPQTCLLVREIKYNEKGLKSQVDKDWALFYSPIENFDHRTDLQQIIRLKRYELQNPPADHSKYVYIYDMTVESTTTNSTL